MYFHITEASGEIDKKSDVYQVLKLYNPITFDLSPPIKQKYPLRIKYHLHFINIKTLKQFLKMMDHIGVDFIVSNFNLELETSNLKNQNDLKTIKKLKVSYSIIIYDDYIE